MTVFELEPPFSHSAHWRKTSPVSAKGRRVLAALEFRSGTTAAVAEVCSLSQIQAERTLRALARRGLVEERAAGWSVSERGLAALV